VADFFQTGRGLDLQGLSSATLSKLEEIKEKTAAGPSRSRGQGAGLRGPERTSLEDLLEDLEDLLRGTERTSLEDLLEDLLRGPPRGPRGSP